MDRRKFLKILAVTAFAGSALAAFAAETVRRIYPGPLKPLDYGKISKPGHWAG